MGTRAITRHEDYGCPPEPFDVTFSVRDKEHLVSVRGRGQVMQLRWPHKGFRPGSSRLAVKAIEHFLARLAAQEQLGGADFEETNRELAIAGRVPAARSRAIDAHDRQLPVADRA